MLTFQSSEVTSLLLGTSCPLSRIQCRSTSWADAPLLLPFRFQIRAVESVDLQKERRCSQLSARSRVFSFFPPCNLLQRRQQRSRDGMVPGQSALAWVPGETWGQACHKSKAMHGSCFLFSHWVFSALSLLH